MTACAIITADFDRVIGLEILTPAPTVVVGDTVTLRAQGLDGRGEPVIDRPVFWAVLDTGLVGFTLDSTGLVTGTAAGTWNVQARLDSIRSNPVPVAVVEPGPDP